jgi:hypothetical protein
MLATMPKYDTPPMFANFLGSVPKQWSAMHQKPNIRFFYRVLKHRTSIMSAIRYSGRE